MLSATGQPVSSWSVTLGGTQGIREVMLEWILTGNEQREDPKPSGRSLSESVFWQRPVELSGAIHLRS